MAILLIFFTITLFQNPYSKNSVPKAPKVQPTTPSKAQMSLFTAPENAFGYKANYTVKYVQVDELNDTSLDGALEMTSASNQDCTYIIEKKQKHVPEPMPHQLILCVNKAEASNDTFDITQCKSSYMIISLFNPKYFIEYETMQMN